MSLGKLLQGSSPAKPTYVLATVQTDFVAKDGSSELTVRVGDDVYVMFSIEGWAFATDLRNGSRRGYVPLSFCKAVEDFYVPADDAPKSTSPPSAAAIKRCDSSAAEAPQPIARRARVSCAAAAEPIKQAPQRLGQPVRPTGVKTCRILSLANCGGSASPAPFDVISCSSLEVSEIEADAEAPCPSVCSPAFSSCSSSSPSGDRVAAAADAAIESGLAESRLGCLIVSERSAFRRPATSSSSSSSERDDGGAPSPADDSREQYNCRPPPTCRYQKFSSRFTRPRFSSADGSQKDASAASSPNYLLLSCPAADSKDCGGSGRQSTSDEGYNSLVKYADTEAWRDRDDDDVVVDDDALSTYSTDYDPL